MQDPDLQAVVADLVGRDAAPLVAADAAALLRMAFANAPSQDVAVGKGWPVLVGSAAQRRKNGEARRTACLLSQQASLNLRAGCQAVYRPVREKPSLVSAVALLESQQRALALLASAVDLAYGFARNSRDQTTVDWRMSRRILVVAAVERLAEALGWQQAGAAVRAMQHAGARKLHPPSLLALAPRRPR